jgi:parvulin-like peptidyl-prolyl isomerase
MAHVPSDHPAVARTGRRRLSLVLTSLVAIALCLIARYYWGALPANADVGNNVATNSAARRTAAATRAKASASSAPRGTAKTRGTPAARDIAEQAADTPPSAGSASSVPEIVATVNTQRITRDELARQCRRIHGAEVLESMVNKYLILAECQRRGVTVTRAEVDAEIERMAKRFGIPVDQWLKMLKQERNISAEQYANDIIWPTLALRRIAGERLSIGRDELIKEFEIQYGEAIRARLIAVTSLEKARKLRAEAMAKPDDFGNLAKDYSEDAPSASAKGVINPIRKHGSYKEIEDAVFTMADGDVSPVIHAGGQYVILKREGLLPARPVKFEQVAPKLEEILRDRKMRGVAQDVFQQLQKDAKVVNVWNDPARRAKMPGVAATINGDPLTIDELDEQCIARHGQEVVEGMISRKILELACKKQNIVVIEEDMQAEIARAALAGVKPHADGSPDVEAWLELVTKKQNIPLEAYRNDVVWPSTALKKLVGDKVRVTDEDLRKGFEANYGPRIRCLAIVLNNQRRAQQVFEMARKNNTAENFGELAAQYSVEPGSQAMRGEVPPIKKFGGQPKLEDEAFALKPGELSGIVQMGDKFIILRCEGRTKAAQVDFADVRQEIHEDLHEKELRLAMGNYFEDLQQAATVDNYLAGTSHSPAPSSKTAPSVHLPSLRQVPGG